MCLEPQIDFTLSGINCLTPLVAYHWTSSIVAVSRTDYSFREFNETHKSKLSKSSQLLHSNSRVHFKCGCTVYLELHLSY